MLGGHSLVGTKRAETPRVQTDDTAMAVGGLEGVTRAFAVRPPPGALDKDNERTARGCRLGPCG